MRRVHPPGRSVWCTASAWLRRGALALGIGLLTISAAQAAGPTATQAVASQTLTKNQPSTNFTPVTGSGGVAPLTYTISPGLPSGLSISASTGAIRGSPTTTLATTSYTVTVTDANSATASNTFSLTINAAVTATRSISSAALTVNQATTAFAPITGGGGTGSLAYSISPTLPSGLSFNTGNGQVSGTPSVTSGTTSYTVTITDANGATASNTFSLTVNSPVTATLAVASVTLTQNHAMTPVTPVTGGGTAPLTFSVSPALPAGLSFNGSNGSISGTPTATIGATTFTVTVSDANSAAASNTFSLTVSGAVTATTAVPSTALPISQAVTPFSPVTGSDGTGTVTYAISPSLPAGLAFNTASGAISGTPTTTLATTTFTVTVTDTNSATANATFNLSVGQVATTVSLTSSLNPQPVRTGRDLQRHGDRCRWHASGYSYLQRQRHGDWHRQS